MSMFEFEIIQKMRNKSIKKVNDKNTKANKKCPNFHKHTQIVSYSRKDCMCQ